MMPFQILAMWVRGLLSIVLLILGPLALFEWYQGAHAQQIRVVDMPAAPATQPTVATTQSRDMAGEVGRQVTQENRVFAPDFGFNRQTALLLAGLATTFWALPKGPLILRRYLRKRGEDEPRSSRTGEVRRLIRPNGSELRVELYGPADAPPVILTHGWGLDSAEWYYARKELTGFRLIVWDLPGLGLSKQPADHDFRLETMARDLDAVIGLAGGVPVVLIGHSIGGMISLTHARLFPEAMGTRVCGLVLINTTYTNPLRTTQFAAVKTAIQKPVIEPLLYLTIGLSPLVWLMNWLSYLNGSAHRSSEKSAFSGHETRGQLDFVTRYTAYDNPAVLARGMLGMLKYDATDTLRSITVPVLVVTGDQDSVCKPDASERMRSEIPKAEMVTLSPARHDGLLEHHGTCDKAVRDFLLLCYQVNIKAS